MSRKALLHEYFLHSTPKAIDYCNAIIATLFVKSRRLKTERIENRGAAARSEGGILRCLQNAFAHSRSSMALRDPQRMNRKPAERDVTDQPSNDLTVGITNVYIQASVGLLPQVEAIVFE